MAKKSWTLADRSGALWSGLIMRLRLPAAGVFGIGRHRDPLEERLAGAQSANTPLTRDELADIKGARAEIRRGDFSADQRTAKE